MRMSIFILTLVMGTAQAHDEQSDSDLMLSQSVVNSLFAETVQKLGGRMRVAAGSHACGKEGIAQSLRPSTDDVMGIAVDELKELQRTTDEEGVFVSGLTDHEMGALLMGLQHTWNGYYMGLMNASNVLVGVLRKTKDGEATCEYYAERADEMLQDRGE